MFIHSRFRPNSEFGKKQEITNDLIIIYVCVFLCKPKLAKTTKQNLNTKKGKNSHSMNCFAPNVEVKVRTWNEAAAATTFIHNFRNFGCFSTWYLVRQQLKRRTPKKKKSYKSKSKIEVLRKSSTQLVKMHSNYHMTKVGMHRVQVIEKKIISIHSKCDNCFDSEIILKQTNRLEFGFNIKRQR